MVKKKEKAPKQAVKKGTVTIFMVYDRCQPCSYMPSAVVAAKNWDNFFEFYAVAHGLTRVELNYFRH